MRMRTSTERRTKTAMLVEFGRTQVQEAAASFSRFSRVTARVPPAAAGSAPSAPSAPPRAIADVAAFAGCSA
eukprot:5297793-Amphidinium_carterae.2